MCRDGHLPSVPPCKLTRSTDNATACGGRIVTRGRCISTSCHTSPNALPFEKCLPKSRLICQVSFPVSVATWTAELSTKAGTPQGGEKKSGRPDCQFDMSNRPPVFFCENRKSACICKRFLVICKDSLAGVACPCISRVAPV